MVAARRRRRSAARRPPSAASPSRSRREPVRAVARVRVCLRRDRADVRLGPRDDRADGEELRLRRDAPLAGVEVARGDRVGQRLDLDRVAGLELLDDRVRRPARRALPACRSGAGTCPSGTARSAAAPSMSSASAASSRAHREVVADRQHGELRLVEVADQLHVAEDARVAGEVDRRRRPRAGSRSRRPRRDTRRRRCSRSGTRSSSVNESPPIRCVPPLLSAGHVADVRALLAEPALQLDLADDLGVREALRERDRVADVVAVAVGDRDHVDALGRLLVSGVFGFPVSNGST